MSDEESQHDDIEFEESDNSSHSSATTFRSQFSTILPNGLTSICFGNSFNKNVEFKRTHSFEYP